jgi:hypothetical protein
VGKIAIAQLRGCGDTRFQILIRVWLGGHLGGGNLFNRVPLMENPFQTSFSKQDGTAQKYASGAILIWVTRTLSMRSRAASTLTANATAS